ncbi:MAG: VOC family protein [Actinomycetota bacterium]
MELNAITLFTEDMAASVAFWLVPGLEVAYGGPDASFTSLRLGPHFVNLTGGGQTGRSSSDGIWGRFIVHVDSPDRVHRAFLDAGYRPDTEPADAPWGERYFHIRDPAGHEVSFARPLDVAP